MKLAQLKVAVESGKKDVMTVARSLQGAETVPPQDWRWLWAFLVSAPDTRPAAVGHVPPLPTPALHATVGPLLTTPHQFKLEYMHGLFRVADFVQTWTQDVDTTRRVLRVLVHQLVPDYFTPAMTGLYNDWKFVYGLVHHFDPRICPHLEAHHISLPVLLTSWNYCLFADILPAPVLGQLYTWVLAEAATSKARSKWLVSVGAALLLYLGDALLAVQSAAGLSVIIDHFCRSTLADDATGRAFLNLVFTMHAYVYAPFPPLRLQSPPEDPSPARLFVCMPLDTRASWPPPVRVWPAARGEGLLEGYLAARPQGFADVEASIEKDVPRTFAVPPGPLRRVLVAFAVRCPRIGYCQGMNEIAAVLLVAAELDEARSFWALVYLLEDVLPDYHAHSMAGLHADCALLQTWLARNDPPLAAHLDALGLNMEILCTTWLVTCFVTNAPAAFHDRLLQCVFAASTPLAASRIPVITALAVLLRLSPQLLLEREAGVVLRRLKQFWASLEDPAAADAVLLAARDLWGQLPPAELATARELHLEQVDALFASRSAKKEALRQQKLEPSPIVARRRFGLATLPSPPKSPIRKLGESVRKNLRIPRPSPTEDDDERDVSVQAHLDTTAQLYEDEAIDVSEFAAIQRRILTSWLDALQTPAHVADRIALLQATIEPPVPDAEPEADEPKKAGFRWHKAAKARVTALGARLRPRSKPDEIRPRRASAPRAMSHGLSPTALQLSDISSSYYGGELSEDQRVARKLELISKSLFD
ncbi:hypothetical protein ACHHYP_02574 [Achlya hypogyna]|uniref:Rab-GAP TBC domain-containing protein n=1 Tax=Achlya hypogyna TaxID=1202772 RepID=A0A1V9Z617_ACHHY|nr:hypothetical protein ACHHYP_02574 [Achlya hypogyna]